MPPPNLVRAPATALIAATALGMLGSLCQIGVVLWMFVLPGTALKSPPVETEDPFAAIDFMLDATLNVATLPFSIVSLFTGAFVVFGAWRMSMLRDRPLALAASITAMIPCVSPCICLGLPIGIWSLAVLCDEKIKQSFS